MSAPRPSVEELVRGTLLAAWMAGCTCNVEVVIEPDPEHRALFVGHCHHDDDCPLLRRLSAGSN